jgi:hydroxyacylglutathione hydrolase
MNVETFTVGMLSTNCYVASCSRTKEAIIIDPGLDYSSEADQIFDYIVQADLIVKYIVNTHGHDDHIRGNSILQERYKVPICIHPFDEHNIANIEQVIPNLLLEEGKQITCGVENLKVIHTPGHTPGSICLIGDKLIFTGDTLFSGSIGRTDFPGGSMKDMWTSLQRLKSLPDQLLVYAGHGDISLIGREKRDNPFLINIDELNW